MENDLPAVPAALRVDYAADPRVSGAFDARQDRMDLHLWLFEFAKALLSESDGPAPDVILQRLLSATEAERGFIVVREGDSFVQRFDVCFGRDAISKEERRFSRGLVRGVIESREIVHSGDLTCDPRFGHLESARMERSAVLVAPLHHDGQVWGVVYLTRRDAAFSGEAQRIVEQFAGIAALFLKRAIEREELRERHRSLEHDLFAQHDFAGIVTRHPRMLELLRMVAQIAASDASVLVTGETGTGKELIARALHVNSARSKKALVTLHTMALSGNVLESELFGHTEGAFTGATRERAGRIASARGGTLFLDEVAEIAPEIQVKLLRFLESGEIQRVGSDRTEKVDARIVAATHQDLAALVREGRFRRDLYHRLKVIELELPPLRERASDISLLLAHFTRGAWKRPGPPPRWTARAEHTLAAYDYPGNVRELRNIVERAVVLAKGSELDVELFPPELRPVSSAAVAPGPFTEYTHAELEEARAAAQNDVERIFLQGLMARHEGNISSASRASGIHRSQLHKLLGRHPIGQG